MALQAVGRESASRTFFCPISTAVNVLQSSCCRYLSVLTSSFMIATYRSERSQTHADSPAGHVANDDVWHVAIAVLSSCLMFRVHERFGLTWGMLSGCKHLRLALQATLAKEYSKPVARVCAPTVRACRQE